MIGFLARIDNFDSVILRWKNLNVQAFLMSFLPKFNEPRF